MVRVRQVSLEVVEADRARRQRGRGDVGNANKLRGESSQWPCHVAATPPLRQRKSACAPDVLGVRTPSHHPHAATASLPRGKQPSEDNAADAGERARRAAGASNEGRSLRMREAQSNRRDAGRAILRVQRGEGPRGRSQLSCNRRTCGGADKVNSRPIKRDGPGKISGMRSMLVPKAVATAEDHGPPRRPIGRCRKQDLLRGRWEGPRRGPVRPGREAL